MQYNSQLGWIVPAIAIGVKAGGYVYNKVVNVDNVQKQEAIEARNYLDSVTKNNTPLTIKKSIVPVVAISIGSLALIYSIFK